MPTPREELEQLRALAAKGDAATPALTPREELDQLRKQSQQPTDFSQLAKEPGMFEAGAIAAGRGLTQLGRAVGLVEEADPAETAAFEALQKERPITTAIGEAVGEAAPFLLPGAGIGAIPSFAGRIVAATGLGLTEGGLISKSRGEDVATGAGIGGVIAGGFEAVFPIIGRMGGKLIRKITGKAARGSVLDAAGRPSAELKQALDASGLSFDDLADEAIKTLKATKPGADPEQAARLARIQSLGAPATTGDVTQEFAQQAAEARLVESSADVLGDPLRTLRLEQSRAFKSQLDNQINKLGVSDEVGDSIKSALEGRKKLLTADKNKLYKQVAEASPDIKAAPIITDTIAEAIPADDILDDLAVTAGEGAIEKVDDLLVKFGINKTTEDVERFLSKTFRGRAATIDPLNVGNFERFRKSLNAIDDPTGALSVYIGPVKRALDSEAGLIDDALRGAGITDESILAPLKEARGLVRQIKTEFSPEAISGRLIKAKRDGVTPLVESSKVFNELMGGQKAPELVERTIESLSKSESGKKAIGDLQARTIIDLLDNAFKAQTRKISGERVFGATAFNKRLEQIGERRLKAVFSTRPGVLKKIKEVGSVAGELTPPSGAVPKGSANAILDALNRTGIMAITAKIPGGGLLVETIRTVVDKGASRKTLDAALKARPHIKKMATFIANDAPGLAAPLGIAFLTKEQKEKPQ